IAFARALPAMRREVARDIAKDGMTRERVLASAVRLLDRGFFRVGGEDYAAENDSYGLATIHKKHVRLIGDDTLRFDYPAKPGLRRRHRRPRASVRSTAPSRRSRITSATRRPSHGRPTSTRACSTASRAG